MLQVVDRGMVEVVVVLLVVAVEAVSLLWVEEVVV